MNAGHAPTRDQSSYRRILTSTSIIGGATVATIIVGILRTKILATLTGPEGIGLLGLLTNISAFVATLANFGLAFAAVRELAAAPSDERKAQIRRTLWVASLPLAIAGSLLLWLLREPATRIAADDQGLAVMVGLSAIAVLLTIIGAIQQSVLQGLQQVKALGWIKIGAALLSTVLAVAAVALVPGNIGLLLATIAVPLSVVLVALPFAPRHLPKLAGFQPGQTKAILALLLRLGAVVTITGSLNQLGLLAVRSLIVRDLGLEIAGLYQAVITITTMNIGLVLGAMSADYYPRLSASSHDRETANRIFNEQLHVALLMGTPLLITLVAGAPLVLRILYTADFAGAETMLRWQLLGDLLKIPGWAMGFILLAFGNRKGVLVSELTATSILLGAAFLLIPLFGLDGAGMAYLGCYVGYGLLMAWLCARLGIRIGRQNLGLILAGVGLLGIVFAVSFRSEPIALGLGALFAGATGIFAAQQLLGRAGLMPMRKSNRHD